MNEIFLSLGIESWKSALAVILLPPVPLLILALVAARMLRKRFLLGWFLLLLALSGLWLSTTRAAGRGMTRFLLHPPPALTQDQIAALKRAPHTAIVVLGGGRYAYAPEYGMSSLKPRTIERLRYGIWLARQTALPLAYSGGIGWGAAPGPTEAEIAARIAAQEFQFPLRWQESESRDTRENAYKTVALLQPLGIDRIVVVTHGYHMQRALADFERAAQGRPMQFVAAPLGMQNFTPLDTGDWLPSPSGMEATWIAMHEFLGYWAGA
ncbi:MAG: YdcF family protein [Burkholderiales bacterium]|nr:YdcF family protein [Burkholderiales bacterium]MDE1928444.1 YdcF family protein [Burkholderiales bacterium]MDE2158984.1 YdcF family protein [Burkholderiales bacterium]MDE2501622.1 YdcF family protein [Burkholderiales bacterium]